MTELLLDELLDDAYVDSIELIDDDELEIVLSNVKTDGYKRSLFMATNSAVTGPNISQSSTVTQYSDGCSCSCASCDCC